jgi:cell division protein FtsN
MNQVFVGNFQSVQVAQAAIKDLSQEGIQSTITQRPNGNYSAIAGTFFYRKEADRQKSRLEEFGFDVTVEKVKVLSNLQELRVGAYPNEEAARGDLARLKSEGLTAVIVGP